MTYSVDGQLLSQEAYGKHLTVVMPSEEDGNYVITLEKVKDWIVNPQQK